MTQLEKIEEMIREYENGSDISAEELIGGIKNVLEDERSYENAMSVDTSAGRIYANVLADEGVPSVSLSFVPDSTTVGIDLCKVQPNEQNGDVLMDVYPNMFSGEWDRYRYRGEEIERFVRDCEYNFRQASAENGKTTKEQERD